LIFTVAGLFFFSCSPAAKPSADISEVPAVSSTQTPVPTVELAVNGVGITTIRADVEKKLGKPKSLKRVGENPCGGRKLTYEYGGLTIDLDPDSPGEKDFMVVGIVVTSPKWEVEPGVRVGMTAEDVQQRLAKGYMTYSTSGSRQLTYSIPDGHAEFHFPEKQVTRIFWQMNLC
jgi:hypothetical protein